MDADGRRRRLRRGLESCRVKETLQDAPALFFTARIALELLREATFVPENHPAIQTAAVAGFRMFLNPRFIDSLTDEAANFVLLHEALHVRFRHAVRFRGRNSNLTNCAGDLAINDLLLEWSRLQVRPSADWPHDHYLRRPKNGCFPGEAPFESLPSFHSAEWYYDRLLKSAAFRRFREQCGLETPSGGPQGSAAPSPNGEAGSDPSGGGNAGANGAGSVPSPNGGAGSDPSGGGNAGANGAGSAPSPNGGAGSDPSDGGNAGANGAGAVPSPNGGANDAGAVPGPNGGAGGGPSGGGKSGANGAGEPPSEDEMDEELDEGPSGEGKAGHEIVAADMVPDAPEPASLESGDGDAIHRAVQDCGTFGDDASQERSEAVEKALDEDSFGDDPKAKRLAEENPGEIDLETIADEFGCRERIPEEDAARKWECTKTHVPKEVRGSVGDDAADLFGELARRRSTNEEIWADIFRWLHIDVLSEERGYLHDEGDVYAASQNLSAQFGAQVPIRGRRIRKRMGGEVLLYLDTSGSMDSNWVLGIRKCLEMFASLPEAKLVLRVVVFSSDPENRDNEYIYWNSMTVRDADLHRESILFEGEELPETQIIDVAPCLDQQGLRLDQLILNTLSAGGGTELLPVVRKTIQTLGPDLETRFKQTLVFTDGGFSDENERWAGSNEPTAVFGESFTWLILSEAPSSVGLDFKGNVYRMNSNGVFHP